MGKHTLADVRTKVTEIIGERVDEEVLTTIQDDSLLIEDLGLDSLYVVQITVDVEEQFGLEIPDENADKFKTVGDIVSYVFEHQ